MSSYLDTIKADYESAEITCLLLHKKGNNELWNLLTVIELVPAEQEASPLIFGDAKTICADRKNIDKEYSLYLTRKINCSVDKAVEIYNNPGKRFLLDACDSMKCNVQLFDETYLETEPPSGYPLIINKETENTIGAVLPHRHTGLRVFSKIDRQKKWMAKFNKKQVDKILSLSGKLTLKHLGFNLSQMNAHLGNVYLCCCNPFLRSYECILLNYNTDLLITFYERQGKTIIGKKLILEDKRAGNIGFSIEKTIESLHERIQLPHFPDQLVTKLFDGNDCITEVHWGKWINIELGMQVQTAELNLTVKKDDKEKLFTIPKYASEDPVKVGKYDHSLTYYLKNQQRNKQIEDLEKSREFIFFPGLDGDKDKARNIIGELLNRASKRCMILDPYFGAGDILYAYLVSNTSVSIQILTSANFLNSKYKEKDGTKVSNIKAFDKAVADYERVFPHQKIEFRVLKGRDKSPLHDRYIIADDTVYLLGSSLGEFGTRATTLFKVPAPELMIDKAMEWWDDESKSISLKDFLSKQSGK